MVRGLCEMWCEGCVRWNVSVVCSCEVWCEGRVRCEGCGGSQGLGIC